MKPPYTTKPFKTKTGAFVKATGWGKVPNTTKYDKLKNEYLSNWWVAVKNLENNKHQYWVFDRYGNRVKILKNCPEQ